MTHVSDMCTYNSGSQHYKGVTLFGTSSGLLVNSGSGSGEYFKDERIEVPGATFTSTNILTFGFSQCGQSTEDVKLHDAFLTFDGMNPSSFDISDIQCTGGGEITSLSYSANRKVFNAVYKPGHGSGVRKVKVLADSFVDDSGNENIVSSEFVWSYVDASGPTVDITASEGDSGFSSSDATLNLKFTLSESVSNFNAEDVSVSGGTLSSFSGSDVSYSAIFTPDKYDGVKKIVVNSNTMSDAAGNGNVVSNEYVWNYATPKDLYDVAYRNIGEGTCMNVYNELPTNTAASLSDISPQKCYDACIKTYGTTNCAGFDTRTGCQIYSFSNDVERNKITTTGNCVSSSNCGDCYVVTTDVTSDTHLWIRGSVTEYVVFEPWVSLKNQISISRITVYLQLHHRPTRHTLEHADTYKRSIFHKSRWRTQFKHVLMMTSVSIFLTTDVITHFFKMTQLLVS